MESPRGDIDVATGAGGRGITALRRSGGSRSLRWEACVLGKHPSWICENAIHGHTIPVSRYSVSPFIARNRAEA